MCSRRMFLSQSRAITAFAVVFLFIAILFGTMAGRASAADGGSDKSGKWTLVYKVDTEKTAWRPEKMDSLVAALRKRVNASWWNGITVTGLPPDKVEIRMPPVSGRTAKERQAEAEEIRKKIRTTGALEFRIVACNRDNALLLKRAKAERMDRKKYPVVPPSTVKIYEGGKEKAKWCPIREREFSKVRGDEAMLNVGKTTVKDAQGNEVKKDVWEMLVLSPERKAYDVTGSDLRDARRGVDENGTPEVNFSFYPAGGMKFSKLTADHVPIGDFKYHLAIVLDDELVTAPTINSVISDTGRITSDFTQQEVDGIVGYINAGSLPAALKSTPVRDTFIEVEAPRGKVPPADPSH
jgi:SecD/SecF fusion protein